MLSVYFEEKVKHDQELQREYDRHASPSATNGFETVQVISDEEDDE